MLTGLVRPDFAVASGLRFRQSPIRWVEAFAILQLLGLATTVAVAAKARRGFELALASLLLLASLLALWSATRIEETIFDHEVFWMSAVGALNIALLASLLVAGCLPDRLPSSLQTATQPPRSVGCCSRRVRRPASVKCLRLSQARRVRRPNQKRFPLVAKQLEAYFDRERIVRPLVRIDQDAMAAGRRRHSAAAEERCAGGCGARLDSDVHAGVCRHRSRSGRARHRRETSARAEPREARRCRRDRTRSAAVRAPALTVVVASRAVASRDLGWRVVSVAGVSGSAAIAQHSAPMTKK